jgi:beta-lactamase superfamily II metal-dependent hydrolase
MNRRRFLKGSAAALPLAGPLWLLGQASGEAAQAPMEPWRRGYLDIHHISTGRGNSVLAILPDGTSLMVDAGAAKGGDPAQGPARPDGSRRPGEWIGRYALHHLRTAPRQELDYFVLTHFHGDHMGDVASDAPDASARGYRLTGVMDVAELVPVRTLIDRGYPAYDYPAPLRLENQRNYVDFVRSRERRGLTVEWLRVGSASQIAAQHDLSGLAKMEVRNLAANGEVWTGDGEDTKQLFPALASLDPKEYPPENPCSIALRLGYGSFRYYIGGDLTCDTAFGTRPWLDIETEVARAAGPVSVAALDHHGYFDGTGPEFVRAMRARIYVVQSWHASHPALSVLDRLYSPILYTGPRDVLATGLVEAASLADGRYSDRMLSRQGHVVVRVSRADANGRTSYEVIVLDDTREDGPVKARFGPFIA